MRNMYSVIAVILFLCMLLLPLTANKKGDAVNRSSDRVDGSDVAKTSESKDVFRVKRSSTGEITVMTAEDYICGVVSAEMPALYENEALKAQAVAAYTFAARKRLSGAEREYDITDDPQTDQAFTDDAGCKEKWGDNYEEYSKKIRNAVKKVAGQTITYNGELIFAAYHAISPGKTETAKNVWGTDYPYLQTVESIGDMLSTGYKSDAVFTPEEFKTKFSGTVELTGEPSGWLTDIKCSSIGTVVSCNVGGTAQTGAGIRQALSLRSANFDVVFENNLFTFTVRGSGHGVGMSQYGANYMALQGSKYKEILLWYYTDCEIKK